MRYKQRLGLDCIHLVVERRLEHRLCSCFHREGFAREPQVFFNRCGRKPHQKGDVLSRFPVANPLQDFTLALG